MSFPLTKTRVGGKIGDDLNRVIDGLNSLRPVSTPGISRSITTGGTSFRVRPTRAAAAAATLTSLTTVREGMDALECLDADSNTVYCLKPPGLRGLGVTTYTDAGVAYGLNAASAPAWIEYKQKFQLLQYSAYANAFRLLRFVKSQNSADYSDNSSHIGAVVYCAAPFFTSIAAGGTVTGTELTAFPVDAVKLASADLSIDAGGDVDATYIDLTPRAWEPVDIFVGRVETLHDSANHRYISRFDLTGGGFFP